MRAAVHVLRSVDLRVGIGDGGLPLATAVARTAERLEEAADVVILAVPAGQGQGIADKLAASDRGPAQRRRARYLSEPDDADVLDLTEGASELPRRQR